MFHYSKRCIVIIFVGLFVLVKLANAGSINDWPAQSEVQSVDFEKHFIQTFKNEPDDLRGLVPNLIKCDIPEDKARKTANISKEVLESPFKNNPSMMVELDIDIDRLNILSTDAGCAQLKSMELEKESNAMQIFYKLPLSFKLPLVVDYKYHAEQTMIMEINGSNHESETEYDMTSQYVYNSPQELAHPEFPQEMYSISDMDMGSIRVHTYSIMFNKADKAKDEVIQLILSRSTTNDDTKNSITVKRKNMEGKDKLTIYGEDSLVSMLDNKMHGLMIAANPLYASDQSQDRLSYTCHNMGERVNIFKVTSGTDCQSVSEDQIGTENVYMDIIYKMQHDMKKQMAAVPKYEAPQKVHNSEARVVAKAQFKNQQETHFNQLLNKAKCSMANENWVYTGNNCKDGMANGEGSAEDRQGLKFIGTFANGNRTKGEIHQGGEMIFSGELINDKPSGNAICLHEKEYEECRFFRGARIDTLYKIRKENAKNLAEIQKTQQNNQVVTSKGKDTSDYVVDALEQEGMKRAASFIFDQLF